MSVTKLFMSFSYVLWELMANRLDPKELDNAVFYFGDTREHMLDGCSWGKEIYGHELQQGIHAYSLLRPKIVNAANMGRVAWRKALNQASSWEQLNQLLQSNNLPLIEPPIDHPWISWDWYSGPAVESIVEEQELPYQVIW